MKQKTDDGFTAADLEEVTKLQNVYHLTRKQAKKRFRKLQKEKREGDATVNNIGGPITGKRQAAKEEKAQRLAKADQEYLDQANEAATHVATQFKDGLKYYYSFKTIFNDPVNEEKFTVVVDFFLHRDRTNSKAKLLGKYARLEDYLQGELHISKSTFYRVRRQAQKQLPEKSGETMPKAEVAESTAPSTNVIDGIDESEETPVDEVPKTPSPSKKPAVNEKLKAENLNSLEAQSRACEANRIADFLRAECISAAKFYDTYGDEIQPAKLRDYLKEMPRRLAAFERNSDVDELQKVHLPFANDDDNGDADLEVPPLPCTKKAAA